MTNGDKIRAMTDHELAELIEALVGCGSPLCKDCQAETGAADCPVIVDGNFVSDCLNRPYTEGVLRSQPGGDSR